MMNIKLIDNNMLCLRTLRMSDTSVPRVYLKYFLLPAIPFLWRLIPDSAK